MTVDEAIALLEELLAEAPLAPAGIWEVFREWACQPVSCDREELEAIWEAVHRAVERMLYRDVVHGDLSAYNVLVWDGELVVIDFPQAMLAGEKLPRACFRKIPSSGFLATAVMRRPMVVADVEVDELSRPTSPIMADVPYTKPSERLDGKREHVANAALGLDDRRRGGIRLQLAPKPQHLHVNAPIEDIFMDPCRLQQIFPRERPAGCREEGGKQRIFSLGQRDEVDVHGRGRDIDAAAVQVGLVGPVALLEQQARPAVVPLDVGAVGHDAAGDAEGGSHGQVAADVVVDAGARVGPHVYRRRPRLDRTVAIKILPAHLSSDPVRKQRFDREAKSISSLNHPHICVLHDVGKQDGIDYLVMECVEGETLAKRLEKGALPLDQLLKIGAQIADALDKAHRGGITHRDLKPGNIMLTQSGAKLLDFGLAKVSSPRNSTTNADTLSTLGVETEDLTSPGSTLGTVAYMSLEQVRTKELDSRTDVFSLGVVLYESATGQPPFRGDSTAEIFDAILNRTPVAPVRLNPNLPAELERIIDKALASVVEPTASTAAAKRSFARGLTGPVSSARSMISVAPSPFR